MAELGLSPARAGRVWWHTHPGESAEPSPIDRVTFARAFGACDRAVMLIVAADGSATATLHRAGLDLVEVPVAIDPPPLSIALELDPARPRWDAEYDAHVRCEPEPFDPECGPGDRAGNDPVDAMADPTLDPDELLALLDLIEHGRTGD
jgi:hypothetical protein